MAQKNPVTDALLNLYELHADTRQAQLDLERAQAKESLNARGAVSGVFAQLQENEAKRQKQRESAQKQQAQGQASPQAMVPPLTDVSGQTGGRDPSSSLKAVGELIEKVSGGGGARRAGQVPGGPQQPAGIGQGINPNAPPPLAGGQINTQVGQAGPAPTGAPMPTGPPGSTQAVQIPLSGGQRALAGVSGLAARNVTAIEEAVTGKRTVGHVQIPTADQQAERFAKPLSALEKMRRSPDPAAADAAEQQYLQYKDRITQEFGEEVWRSADLQAEDLNIIEEEQRLAQAADPDYRQKQLITDIVEKGIDDYGSLTSTERMVFDRKFGNRPPQQINVNVLQPGTATQMEKQISANLDVIQNIQIMREAYYPEFYERSVQGIQQGQRPVPGTTGDIFLLEQKNKAPALFGALTSQEEERLNRHRALDQAQGTLTQEKIRASAGLTQSAAEIALTMKTVPNENTSPAAVLGYLDRLQERMGLANVRYESMLRMGITNPEEMASTLPLASAPALAKSIARQRAEQLAAEGVPPDQARRKIELEFMDRYGLDINRIMARP